MKYLNEIKIRTTFPELKYIFMETQTELQGTWRIDLTDDEISLIANALSEYNHSIIRSKMFKSEYVQMILDLENRINSIYSKILGTNDLL